MIACREGEGGEGGGRLFKTARGRLNQRPKRIIQNTMFGFNWNRKRPSIECPSVSVHLVTSTSIVGVDQYRQCSLATRGASPPACEERLTAWTYEFIRFGINRGWACLFGGIMAMLMIA